MVGAVMNPGQVHSNTFYEQGGSPCGETPPGYFIQFNFHNEGAAGSLQELMIQSWNKEIDVFPGVDDNILKGTISIPYLYKQISSSIDLEPKVHS
jgi:hypothetical protein